MNYIFYQITGSSEKNMSILKSAEDYNDNDNDEKKSNNNNNNNNNNYWNDVYNFLSCSSHLNHIEFVVQTESSLYTKSHSHCIIFNQLFP